jgi:hypothetical protein
MNKLRVDNVRIEQNRIDILFHTSDGITNYFSKEQRFWMEYSISLQEVPVGIAVIPFVCNVLPIIWITNSELILSEIDKDFFESITDFKKGYANMYPNIKFEGKVSPNNIVEYPNKKESNRYGMFFSGGVDAFATLIAHINQKPDLLTIWGADVTLEDKIGWENVQSHIKATSAQFDLRTVEIKSNFRTFINPNSFGKEAKKWDYNYWYNLQHGIGIIGHAAPYAFLADLSVVYIASSFSPLSRQNHNYSGASDPGIDNYVRFNNTTTLHDQAEHSRQDKIDHIIDFISRTKNNIHLRVCWESSGGKNCCMCEKCYRTIMGIIASGGDPIDYGFTIIQLGKIRKYICDYKIFNWVNIEFWLEIQEGMKRNKVLPKYVDEVKWILDYDFHKVNNSLIKQVIHLLKRIKNILRRITKSLFNLFK